MTIRDLALHCGVSNATVSLALRGHPRIPKATKERILREAERVGYRVNPMVSALLSHVRTQKPIGFQEVIAVLTTEATVLRKRQPYHRAVAEGVIARATHLGFGVDFFQLGGESSDQRVDQMLLSRGIRGVLLDPSCQDIPLPVLDWQRLSSVLMTYNQKNRSMRRVIPDQFHNMEELLVEMRERGYKRIGFYNLERFETRVHGHWAAAFLRHQLALPAKERVAIELAPDWDTARFLAWVRKARPDGIVCPHWMAYAWLQEAGYRVPADIGLAVPNWSPLHARVSGIDQNPADIGSAAVDVLVSQLTRNESGLTAMPRMTMIPGQYREGQTLRPRPPESDPGTAEPPARPAKRKAGARTASR